jgi:hypothetical protein
MGSGCGSEDPSGVGVIPPASGMRIGEVAGARRLGPCIGISGNRDAGADDGPVV